MTNSSMLGYLANFGSFYSQSEVLSTQGLTFALQTCERARSALEKAIAESAGISTESSLTWRPEVIQADQGRVDIEGASGDKPVVKIEAKLGAPLSSAQLQSYEQDLRSRNPGHGALIVLVPKNRKAETIAFVRSTFNEEGDGPWSIADGRDVGLAVLSWDELFAVLLGGDVDERCRWEIEQLQEMYKVLLGDNFEPIASEEELGNWPQRTNDFIKLVDRATRELTDLDLVQKTYPWQSNPEYPGRYVPMEQGSDGSGDYYPAFYIGVRHSFAKYLTPIWMRLPKETPYFDQIVRCVDPSGEYPRDGGHLWLPLSLKLDTNMDGLVAHVVAQAKNYLADFECE